MKIKMTVIDFKMIDGYIDARIVPFAVCIASGSEVSKKQQRFLEKYYDRIVDKRGWVSFYCNIINPWKCKDMGYESIEFSDGTVETIQSYALEENASVDDKYVVVQCFNKEKKFDSVSLVKLIRLDVEKMKNKINGKEGK